MTRENDRLHLIGLLDAILSGDSYLGHRKKKRRRRYQKKQPPRVPIVCLVPLDVAEAIREVARLDGTSKSAIGSETLTAVYRLPQHRRWSNE